jgi:hypothetical protein
VTVNLAAGVKPQEDGPEEKVENLCMQTTFSRVFFFFKNSFTYSRILYFFGFYFTFIVENYPSSIISLKFKF